MIDIHLRAATEADAITALQPFGLYAAATMQHPESWIDIGPGWSLVALGPLVTTEGAYTTNADGTMNQVTAPIIDGAFHLNVRLATPDNPLAAQLAATGLVITVASPRVVWA